VRTQRHDRAAQVAAGSHLMLDYRPSQVTGWSAPYSPTIGGHAAARDFTCRGRAYRVSLLSFGQSATAPGPVYETVPADPVIKFQQTLATSWGRYYTFRYRGACHRGRGSPSSPTASRSPVTRAA